MADNLLPAPQHDTSESVTMHDCQMLSSKSLQEGERKASPGRGGGGGGGEGGGEGGGVVEKGNHAEIKPRSL